MSVIAKSLTARFGVEFKAERCGFGWEYVSDIGVGRWVSALMRRATAIILVAAGLLVIANEVGQWLKFRELERQVLELSRKYDRMD